MAAAFAATPTQGPDLAVQEAVDLALAQARTVVRARADVLLADTGRARSLASVLPSFRVILGVYEDFQGKPRIERRAPEFCTDPIAQEACTSTLDYAVGPFIDQQQINNSSAPRFDLRFVARQLVWDGGRSWSFLDRAGEAQDRSRALLRVVENNIRLDVVRRFYGLAAAEQTTRAFERRVALDEAQLARARTRLSENRGTEADVAAAERNLAEDRLTLARRRFAADRARRNLNLAMGRPGDIPVELSIPKPMLRGLDPVPQTNGVSEEELLHTAQRLRPDLIAGRHLLKMQDHSVAAQTALRWPSVFLDASYRRLSRRPDRVFADPSNNYTASVGLDIRWNAFEGLRDEASIEAAEIQRVKARADYQDLERRVLAEVQDRRQNLEIQIEVYRLAREALRPAEDTVRLSRQRKEAGTGSTLELRDAELRFTQTQLSAINARLQIEIAREELRRAVGADLH